MAQKWSDEELSSLCQYVSADMTWNEIATAIGRTLYAVRTKAVEKGYRRRKRAIEVEQLRVRWLERMPELKANLRHEIRREGVTL